MASPGLSPRPREALHLHSSPSRSQRPATTSRTHTSRTPGTIAQTVPLPPSRAGNELKTPFTAHEVRTESPNYFGLAVHSNTDCFASSPARHARENWSPPTSNVRSAAVPSPKFIPVDSNPAFEAFRRQSETHRISLGSSLGSPKSLSPTSSAHNVPFTKDASNVKPHTPATPRLPMSPHSLADATSSIDNMAMSPNRKRGSPKRMLSSDSSVFPDRPRRNSPASFANGISSSDEEALFLPEATNNSSLPMSKSSMPSTSHKRAETLPDRLQTDASNKDPVVVTPQHVVGLMEASEDEILLLDLRVSTQYARLRIAGSLNLCIPTTLLKRASFNIAKLAETFKDEQSKKRFERWRSSKYIIVYDADSVQLKDATTCMNTLKKFANEGWTGCSYVIRGGFADFSEKFPHLVTGDSRSTSDSRTSSMSVDSDGPSIAPVVGGCPMPVTKNAANPFFGNIRQNVDLIGGVGQMPIKQPSGLTEQAEGELPAWLTRAINTKDDGKLVSDKFLQIEKLEQRRMQEALSSDVVYGTPGPGQCHAVKIAGIEKGSKNRYNSIWPYEHSRVKLQEVAYGACDYVNASHVKASWSNKRYIATQGPLPTTFNDFWEVVWQQGVRVIVMLTAETEGGLIKAHNYWSGRKYGPITLNFLSEHRASLEPEKIHRHKERPKPGQRRSTNAGVLGKIPKEPPPPSSGEQPYVTVRKYTLSHADHPFERMREITQLQYSSWPDFGAPAHPAHLLGLVEQCDAVVRAAYGGVSTSPEPPNAPPVLVHCSAGCGRTGTFCTVDTVIDMLRRQRLEKSKQRAGRGETQSPNSPSMEIDSGASFNPPTASDDWTTNLEIDLIEKTVEEFRNQRLSMVQSLRQFVLCYETVLEWLVAQQPKTA